MNQQFYILKSQEGRGFYLNNLKVIQASQIDRIDILTYKEGQGDFY